MKVACRNCSGVDKMMRVGSRAGPGAKMGQRGGIKSAPRNYLMNRLKMIK
jgi:hypothetical protein